jgi:hypothetical protein
MAMMGFLIGDDVDPTLLDTLGLGREGLAGTPGNRVLRFRGVVHLGLSLQILAPEGEQLGIVSAFGRVSERGSRRYTEHACRGNAGRGSDESAASR